MKPLKGNKNVEVLFSSGKRVSSSFLHCVYLLNKEDSRFVVSVPKKNFSLAVDRNKLKRILREVVRKHSKDLLSFGGGWFMFVYSSEKVASFLDIEKALELPLVDVTQFMLEEIIRRKESGFTIPTTYPFFGYRKDRRYQRYK